jgi:hypothetical protein
VPLRDAGEERSASTPAQSWPVSGCLGIARILLIVTARELGNVCVPSEEPRLYKGLKIHSQEGMGQEEAGLPGPARD